MNQSPLEMSNNENAEVTAIDLHCPQTKAYQRFHDENHNFKGFSVDLEKNSTENVSRPSLSTSDQQTEMDAHYNHSETMDTMDISHTQSIIEPEVVSRGDNATIPSRQENNDIIRQEVAQTTNESQAMDTQIREAYIGLQEAETKLHLSRIIGFFVTMVICSAYILLITHFDIDPYMTYTFIICYLGYFDMFTIFLAPETLREIWIDSDDFYKLGDITCGLIFIVVLLLRLSDIISMSYYVSAVFFASLVIYKITSSTPPKYQVCDLLTRSYYFLQAVTVTLKLDGILLCEWNLVFLPSWLYAAGLLFFFTRSISGLLSQLIRNRTSSIGFKMIGFLWYLFYRISILSLVGILAGVAESRNTETDYAVLNSASYISLILSVSLLITTLIKKKMIVTFIVTFDLGDSNVLRYTPEELVTFHEKLKKITFELQEKKAYFRMISPTYFLPLDQSPSLNNKEHANVKSLVAKTNQSTLELSEYPLLDKELGNSLQTTLLSQQDKEEKNFCYVCCKDPSNTIFTTCGHGGVCLDCAIASVKQKGECLQCRKKIEAIHTIDPNQISSNVIKSMQSYKIVKT